MKTAPEVTFDNDCEPYDQFVFLGGSMFVTAEVGRLKVSPSSSASGTERLKCQGLWFR